MARMLSSTFLLVAALAAATFGLPAVEKSQDWIVNLEFKLPLKAGEKKIELQNPLDDEEKFMIDLDEDSKVDTGNINRLVDLFLIKVNRNIPDEIYFGELGGPANFDNCYSRGLENGIRREGDATLLILNGEAKLVVGMRMTGLGLACDWRWFVLFWGDFVVTTEKVALQTGFLLIMEEGQHPWITEFRVTTFEKFDLEVTGIPGLNWLVEGMLENAINELQESITYFIEHTVRDIVQGTLNDMIVGPQNATIISSP